MRRRLAPDEIAAGLREAPGWTLRDGTRIVKRYAFGDFAQALAFVQRIGAAAEEQDHHPDVCLGWGYAEVSLSTHSAGGVTALDFRLAASCDDAHGG